MDDRAPTQGAFPEPLTTAGTHWNHAVESAVAGTAWWAQPRSSWWNDPPTLRHINKLVCGQPIDGFHAGFHRRLADLLRAHCTTPPRGLSVGCGTGGKELGLILAGVVGSFECYDVSTSAIAVGQQMAAEYGVADRLRFHHADALATSFAEPVDLVYWNSALHHMLDTEAAVAWSRERLRIGGVFAIDDYVGANRFQYSDALLAWTNRMIAMLPDRLLRAGEGDGSLVPRIVGRMDADSPWFTVDPTEAADSARILPAIARHFPGAEVIRTGGALYFAGFNRITGLNRAFHNFSSWEDLQLLEALLLVDQAVGEHVETQYAVVFAIKGQNLPCTDGPAAGLQQRITALEAENALFRASTSWRLTAPLRALGHLIKG